MHESPPDYPADAAYRKVCPDSTFKTTVRPRASAGKIGLPEDILPNRRRTPLSTLFLCCSLAYAQTIAFELQTNPDSPVALVSLTPSTFRTQSDRRQFLTVKNDSD